MASTVRIGSPGGRLELKLHWLERGGSYYTDSLLADASAAGPGFQFLIAQQVLLAAELTRFRGELAQLYRALTGTAGLHTMDGDWLEIRLSGDGRGHIDGWARLRNLSRDELTFGLHVDQTDLPEVLDQIEIALDASVGDAPML